MPTAPAMNNLILSKTPFVASGLILPENVGEIR